MRTCKQRLSYLCVISFVFFYLLSKAYIDASSWNSVQSSVKYFFSLHVVNSAIPLSLELFSAGVSMTFRVIQKCTLGRNLVEECRMTVIGVFCFGTASRQRHHAECTCFPGMGSICCSQMSCCHGLLILCPFLCHRWASWSFLTDCTLGSFCNTSISVRNTQLCISVCTVYKAFAVLYKEANYLYL